jgi:hypothetical protein
VDVGAKSEATAMALGRNKVKLQWWQFLRLAGKQLNWARSRRHQRAQQVSTSKAPTTVAATFAQDGKTQMSECSPLQKKSVMWLVNFSSTNKHANTSDYSCQGHF